MLNCLAFYSENVVFPLQRNFESALFRSSRHPMLCLYLIYLFEILFLKLYLTWQSICVSFLYNIIGLSAL